MADGAAEAFAPSNASKSNVTASRMMMSAQPSRAEMRKTQTDK